MTISTEHWRYFLALEADIERTTRYVEPTPANYRTYSIEFARLILGTCSEVDVVSKVLCEQEAPGKTVANMDDYRAVLLERLPKLAELKVLVPRFQLALEPWKEWLGGTNPGWWRDHQKVKHRRHEFFALADLEHCIVAAGGLYALLLYLYRDQLFMLHVSAPARFFATDYQPNAVMGGDYKLPM